MPKKKSLLKAISGTKKKSLLKALSDKYAPDTYPDPKRNLRLSRKTGKIIVTDPTKSFSPFRILPNKLDDEIDRMTRVAKGTGPQQRLLDGLLAARNKYGRLIEGKHKPRGIHAKTENKTLA